MIGYSRQIPTDNQPLFPCICSSLGNFNFVFTRQCAKDITAFCVMALVGYSLGDKGKCLRKRFSIVCVDFTIPYTLNASGSCLVALDSRASNNVADFAQSHPLP